MCVFVFMCLHGSSVFKLLCCLVYVLHLCRALLWYGSLFVCADAPRRVRSPRLQYRMSECMHTLVLKFSSLLTGIGIRCMHETSPADSLLFWQGPGCEVSYCCWSRRLRGSKKEHAKIKGKSGRTRQGPEAVEEMMSKMVHTWCPT